MILLALSLLERLNIVSFLPAELLFTLPLIYYWAIHRPELLSPFSLFLVGVFDDILAGALIGQTSLLLMVLYGVVLLQKHHVKGSSFSIAWVGFCCYMLIATFVEWGIASVIHEQFISLTPFIIQNVLAAVLYPWFNKIVILLEKQPDATA